MRYQISHTTTYTYSQPVTLQPHLIRLKPRSDAAQTVQMFSLMVSPIPAQQSPIVDLDGNSLVKVWFPPPESGSLNVQVLSQVETHRSNPFDYLLEPWAVRLPIDYPASLLKQLQPYLAGQQLKYSSAIDPIALQLAQEIAQEVDAAATSFLTTLNDRIFQNCKYTIRETGEPQPAGFTWMSKLGSCRDFAVLFVEVCRAIGLPARFVSGYQQGDLDRDDRHLHAWAEVYLPGAGWRGYDPTQGAAVADRHIALVSSADSAYAAPISGSFKQTGGVQSKMTYQLQISEASREV